MTTIEKIISGGQTGVDRAALEAAIESDIEYGGWCPFGGWAEDYPTPPGILEKYPCLQATLSKSPNQRTEWNVRDSDITIILLSEKRRNVSSGTAFTIENAKAYSKPYEIIILEEQDCLEKSKNWLLTFQKNLLLNVAGPRESESPRIFDLSRDFLMSLFKNLK